MNKYAMNQSDEEFEAELRSLAPRAPQISMPASGEVPPVFDKSPAVNRIGTATLLASSWTCGAAIGAAIMFFMLSDRAPTESVERSSTSNALAEATRQEDRPLASQLTPAKRTADPRALMGMDWLDRIQQVPSGSLSVRSSILISQSRLIPQPTEPMESISTTRNDEELFEQGPTSKSQRELLQELLGQSRQVL